MIEDIKQILELMGEMSSVIDRHVCIYLIGGGAMMFLGAKKYTKDLDFVVSNGDDYGAVLRALSVMGFRSDKPSLGMDRANLSDTQVLGEYRIDLFNKVVCGQLQLSDTVMERSSKRYDSDNISLYTCSGEDIFLFKSVTEREGDISDCENLIRAVQKFEWSSFIEELRIQMTFGKPVWITFVTERMVRMGYDELLPDIFGEISQMEKEFMTKWADDFERNKE